MKILRCEQLTKKNHRQMIYENISLELEEGSFCALIGAHSGEIMQGLVGICPKTKGMIFFKEEKVDDLSKAGPKRVAYVPDDICCERDMSVESFFQYTFYSMTGKCKEEQLSAMRKRCSRFCELFSVDKTQKLLEMTYEENKIVTLINALMAAPDLLLLDRPDHYLGEEKRDRFFDVLKEEKKLGMSCVIACDAFEAMDGLADSYFIEKNGIEYEKGILPKDFFLYRTLITFREKEIPAHEKLLLKKERGEEKEYLFKGTGTEFSEVLKGLKCADFYVMPMLFEQQVEEIRASKDSKESENSESLEASENSK